MGALGKTIGMLIVCLVLLGCCWGVMLRTVIRCNIMEGCRGFDKPAGWLFWLMPLVIWGVGSKVLAGGLREGLADDDAWALGCFWMPLLAGAMLLMMSQ